MLYPLRQKRSFFRAFFKVFSKHSVFNRQNTKKNDVFDKPKKVRVRKRPFYRAFLLVFYRWCFFELFDEIWRKKVIFPSVFAGFFKATCPSVFLKKSKNSRFFACFFVAVELRVVLASTTKEWADPVGEYLGRGSLLLEEDKTHIRIYTPGAQGPGG